MNATANCGDCEKQAASNAAIATAIILVAKCMMGRWGLLFSFLQMYYYKKQLEGMRVVMIR